MRGNTGELCRKGYVFRTLMGVLISMILILAYSPAAHAVQVTLAWDPPATGTVDGYLVFSRLEGQSYDYSQPAWEGSATTCTFSDVQDETTYFVVRAQNSSGESGDSNEAMYEPATSTPTTSSEGGGGGGGGAGCFIASGARECTGDYQQLILILGVVLRLALFGYPTRIRK